MIKPTTFIWASRFAATRTRGALRRLASGYPLHHVLRFTSHMVPLLSLSLRRKKCLTKFLMIYKP
jgi:hypothetical protein